MDRIEYFNNRKKALKFIYNNNNRSISRFLSSNDEIFLKEFADMGFIEIDEPTNTYNITKLGKEYIEEFYN